MTRPGRVFLVGAGPGDPGLLTVRALELLRGAEVVAYDELVPMAIVDLAHPAAERVAVGRRRGRGSVPYRVHPAVIERARAGRDVIRLKTGDPFVFGRGGEEIEELTEAGIEVDVVPGITAALGAAAATGIPLTHRGVSSSVTLVTGHDGAALTTTGTLVLYMAAHTLTRCLEELIAAGRSPATPAALIIAATLPHQRTVHGTLADLAGHVVAAGGAGDDPAVAIVGEVVAVGAALAAAAPAMVALAGHRVVA